MLVDGLRAAKATPGARARLVGVAGECVLDEARRPMTPWAWASSSDAAKHRAPDVRLTLLTHAHHGHAGNTAELRGADPRLNALVRGHFPTAPPRLTEARQVGDDVGRHVGASRGVRAARRDIKEMAARVGR